MPLAIRLSLSAGRPDCPGNARLQVPAMREIVARSPSQRPEEMEDVYFARHVYARNHSRLASRRHAYDFAIEVGGREGSARVVAACPPASPARWVGARARRGRTPAALAVEVGGSGTRQRGLGLALQGAWPDRRHERRWVRTRNRWQS